MRWAYAGTRACRLHVVFLCYMATYTVVSCALLSNSTVLRAGMSLSLILSEPSEEVVNQQNLDKCNKRSFMNLQVRFSCAGLRWWY